MIEFKVRFRTLAVVVTIALAMLVTGTAIGATLQKNGGPVTAVRTATSDEVTHTNTGTWSDLPGMSVGVNIPSGERALLVVTFSAEHQCYAPNVGDAGQCQIRVLVDGNPAQPLQTVFATGTGANQHLFESNSMQFVAGPKLAGAHTLKVQFRVETLTNLAFTLGSRTLTVLRSRA